VRFHINVSRGAFFGLPVGVIRAAASGSSASSRIRAVNLQEVAKINLSHCLPFSLDIDLEHTEPQKWQQQKLLAKKKVPAAAPIEKHCSNSTSLLGRLSKGRPPSTSSSSVTVDSPHGNRNMLAGVDQIEAIWSITTSSGRQVVPSTTPGILTSATHARTAGRFGASRPRPAGNLRHTGSYRGTI
jgi:hypothetical protein